MNIDDPKLTAHALDQLDDPAERLEVETWLANNPAGHAFVAETRQMAALLSEKLHRSPVPTLTAEQRAVILRGFAMLPNDKEAFPYDKDAFPYDKDAFPYDKEAFPCDKDALPCDKDALPCDKDALPCDKDALPCDKDALPCDKDATTKGKIRRVSFITALTALAACLLAGPFLPWGELLRLQKQPEPTLAANSGTTFQVSMADDLQKAPVKKSRLLDQPQTLALGAKPLLAQTKTVSRESSAALDAVSSPVVQPAAPENQPSLLAEEKQDARQSLQNEKRLPGQSTSATLASRSIAVNGVAIVVNPPVAAPLEADAEAANTLSRSDMDLAAASTTVLASIASAKPAPMNYLDQLQAEADAYFAQGRYDLAWVRWQQILQLDPKNAAALAGIASYEKARKATLLALVKDKTGKDGAFYQSNAPITAPSNQLAKQTNAKTADAAKATAQTEADLPTTAPVLRSLAATGATARYGVAGEISHSALNGGYYAGTDSQTQDESSPAMGGNYRDAKEPGNTEAYDAVSENPFLAAKENPLSTFSIDVDTASYSNLRRFLNSGQLPPRGAVRIEEMLNYFSYNYPAPTGDTPFSTNFEVSECPWQPEHRLVRIGLRGKDLPASERPAGNLVFLIDVSGSMDTPAKLPLLKQSLRLLVDQLSPQDRVAIVVYAGNSGLVLPSTSDKERIRAALDNLEAGGSTNGTAGINLAYQVATENFIPGGINRVILATDGDFNVGVTSQSALVDMIKEKAKTGVFLSLLGFGTENLQDSTMQKLADRGNGNYAYIDSLAEGRKVLVEQMGGTLCTIAKDVKLQVEFNPSVVSAYRLIGYEKRMLRKEDFNDDQKDAGEIGANLTVTALYEVVPVGSLVPVGAVDALKYSNNLAQGPVWPTSEMLTVKLRYKQPASDTSTKLEFPLVDQGGKLNTASVDFRFAAAVAEAGLLLRQSENKELAGWDATVELAANALGEDRNGYRKEFVDLLRKAETLARKDG